MPTTIKLYGSLRRRYGKELIANVSSVGEALKALSANFPSFREFFMREDSYYLVKTDSLGTIQEHSINLESDVKVIKIIPAVSGSKGGMKLILGAVMVALSFYPPTAAFMTGALGTAGFAIFKSVGISLLLGGIMELLFKPPIPEYIDPGTKEPSYNFNGAINTVAQGRPVPVGYGKLLVGSAVIGAGIHTRNS